jgi:hypothetical protein
MHVLELIRRKLASAKALRRLVLLVVAGCCSITAAHAASLDPAVLPKIQAATFEVVAAKPVHDPLTYEKPLPLELLPFQERNDKYYSIGTAFAIDNHRYVTAGHVLLAGVGSLWGLPELRDAAGHVYAIDKIEKFSLRKDFVVFTLASQPAGAAGFEMDLKPAQNQVVYAVGNALGTGVVIRDGLYTSDTPEEQDGSWKWMRFSAAASPGNSGGPLLDKDGRLIGIVLMKSANENLNYALPISEVLSAPAGVADIDERVSYQFDVVDTVQNGIFKTQFALPMNLVDFDAKFQTLFDGYSDTQLKTLLDKESAKLFPNGTGSSSLLYSQPWLSSFPSLIVRNASGKWALVGKEEQHFPLDNNGYVSAGYVGNNFLFHLRRPDSLAADKLYGDQGVLMDQLAKTGMFQRQVGSEKIKITSLGEPTTQSVHTDVWQRRWQVSEWSAPYLNSRVVMYSLPVPDGYVMMMRFAQPGHEHDSLLDLGKLTDFVYMDYDGTLAQWKDYLKNAKQLPVILKDIKIDFEEGKRFSYASRRMAFSFTPELQPISADSLLTLGFSYFHDGGRVVWDVADVRLWKNKDSNDQNRINIQRFMAPPKDLDDDDAKSLWQKVSQRQHPYDGVARNESDVMKIDAVVDPPKGAASSVLYTIFYGVEGNHPQAFMKAKLDLLNRNMQVLEH